jgi:hypothetical protein
VTIILLAFEKTLEVRSYLMKTGGYPLWGRGAFRELAVGKAEGAGAELELR